MYLPPPGQSKDISAADAIGLCMTGNRLTAIAKIATLIFRVRKIECNFITNPLIDSSIPGEMPSGEPGAELRVPKSQNC
jgi:hypothetical protein